MNPLPRNNLHFSKNKVTSPIIYINLVITFLFIPYLQSKLFVNALLQSASQKPLSEILVLELKFVGSAA